MSTEKKKSASEVIIDRFLADVDERGTMPWQRPYERYNAFNYFSKKAYRGINRLMLPFGEYMTRNQITQYNLEKGYIELDSNGRLKSATPEAYKMQKGIKWYPVVFFKKDIKKMDKVTAESDLDKVIDLSVNKYWGRANGYLYYTNNGEVFKERSILRYYMVADRKHFRNEKGECLPSRIDTGEVVISTQEPKQVFDSYIQREGIHLTTNYTGTPCYIPMLDEIKLNPYIKSEEAYFSVAFHEAGHSTGAEKRLNRAGVAEIDTQDKEKYAVEECIAEICACLCCAETGITDFETSGMAEYENSIAYVQSWKKRILDWGKDFIYIVSQADKAFNYICNNPDGLVPTSEEE